LRLLALLICGSLATAQTLNITAPKTQLKRGEVVTLTYSLVGTANVAAVQFTELPNSRFSLANRVLAAPVSTTLGKALHCENNSCVVVGLNRNVIPNGNVLTVDLLVLPNAEFGQGVMQLQSVLAAAPDGTAAALTAGPPVTFTILGAPEDLNQDGKIDLIDVQISVDQGLGRAPCGSADLDKSGQCDIRDIQLLVAAAVAQ